MQMIESLALAFFPLINGALIEKGNNNVDNPNGYRNSSLFFVLVGLVGMLTSLGLIFIPDKYKRKLDRASAEKMKVEHGKDGELIFSASEAEDTENDGNKKEIEITRQASNENLRIGLLN